MVTWFLRWVNYINRNGMLKAFSPLFYVLIFIKIYGFLNPYYQWYQKYYQVESEIISFAHHFKFQPKMVLGDHLKCTVCVAYHYLHSIKIMGGPVVPFSWEMLKYTLQHFNNAQLETSATYHDRGTKLMM